MDNENEEKTVTAEEFFLAWKEVCEEKKDDLVTHWESLKDYTKDIFYNKKKDFVLEKIKYWLQKKQNSNWELQEEYYKCDAVFYLYGKDNFDNNVFQCENNAGVQPLSKLNGIWLKKIRIHFQHENDVKTSWQELTQFCIIPADLNVLVTYPRDKDHVEAIKTAYQKILIDAKFSKNLLVIFGFLDNTTKAIEWQGYKWEDKAFKPI